LSRAVLSAEGARANFGLLGDSPEIQRVLRIIDRLRGNRWPVLLEGESGAGKELVARALHAVSPGPSGAFVVINAAALAPSLIESELFGHAPGSYTGALGARQGLLEQAHGGTLFLDEVGELALEMQSKLLRAVEHKLVRPVGANREVPVDIRLIAATNRNLAAEVERGCFRADLYYRLNVIRVRVGPLRERRSDIPVLARHFLERYGRPGMRLSARLLDWFAGYDWPGNVRELENTIQRMVALSSHEELDVDDLPTHLRNAAEVERQGPGARLVRPLASLERSAIEDALRLSGGDRGRAARLLGISRTTLYRKLKQYDRAASKAHAARG
jgi:two-component system response regulator AtoC